MKKRTQKSPSSVRTWTYFRCATGRALEEQRKATEAFLLKKFRLSLNDTIEIRVADRAGGKRAAAAVSQLISAAEVGLLKSLVIYCPTRLSRDFSECMRIVRKLHDAGAVIHVASYGSMLVPGAYNDGVER